jgi:hypothetical protein
MRYDPDVAPDPVAWLAADAHERGAAVRAAVARERLPRGSNRELHAIVHETIENQLAQRDPPEVVSTLDEVQRGGLGRHEALHAIGRALTDELFAVMHEGRPFDAARYVAALRELVDSSR